MNVPSTISDQYEVSNFEVWYFEIFILEISNFQFHTKVLRWKCCPKAWTLMIGMVGWLNIHLRLLWSTNQLKFSKKWVAPNTCNFANNQPISLRFQQVRSLSKCFGQRASDWVSECYRCEISNISKIELFQFWVTKSSSRSTTPLHKSSKNV